MAQAAGDQAAIVPLQQTLQEEEKMAQWIGDHLPETVKTYISRETSGQKAGI
jgi:ferritin-like metal-binding protein YciE